jgi:hypothetical protein
VRTRNGFRSEREIDDEVVLPRLGHDLLQPFDASWPDVQVIGPAVHGVWILIRIAVVGVWIAPPPVWKDPNAVDAVVAEEREVLVERGVGCAHGIEVRDEQQEFRCPVDRELRS